MKVDVIERIKKFCSDNNISINELAKRIDMPQTTVNNYIIGSRKVSYELVQKIISSFELDANWLLTGKGEMLKSEKQINNISIPLQYPLKPYIDSAYAICGTPSGFELAVNEKDCDTLSLPFMKDYDFSIKAKGDSMINRTNPQRTIKDGDIVACRIWKNRSYLRWGEIYALSTSEGVILKKIMKSEREGYIKCVSFNVEDGFEPFDLPISEISDWAIVVGVVSAINWN